jgi:hypothetical protein
MPRLVQSQAGFVGARPTKVRQLSVDVSDVAVGDEFIIRIEATYLGSLQDPADRWVGAVGYPRSDRIRIVILMPENHPLQSYKLQTAPSNREVAKNYDGPLRLLESDDKLSLMWEIPNPQSNFVYTIVLDW